MKAKILIIAVLLVLVAVQVPPTAGMAKPERQWVFSYQVENNYALNALEVFQDQLYAGSYDATGVGSSIFRTGNGKDWSQVTQPAFGQLLPVPEDWAYQDLIYDMTVFQGKLYVGHDQWIYSTVAPEWEPLPGEIWRTSNGTDWEAVVTDGFGVHGNEGVVGFSVFNGMLYAGVANFFDGFSIYRSPNGTDWEMVADMGLGYSDTAQITGFEVFKDMLFVTAEGWDVDGNSTPVRVWYSRDGLSWQAVTTDGFGNPDIVSPGGFAVFKNSLYLGMENAGMAELWKTDNGLDWEQVDLSAIVTPDFFKIDGAFEYDGSLYLVANSWGGMGLWGSPDGLTWEQVNEPGFGSPANWASHWSTAMAKFKGDLYVGTFNWDSENNTNTGQIWRWCSTCK